jgi:hypothetical protein
MQSAVDRSYRDLKQVCNLACTPIQHVREQQDGPLARGEQLKGGEESQRNTLLSAIAGFRILRRLGQPTRRKRLKPECLRLPLGNRSVRVPRRRGGGRQPSRRVFLEEVQAAIGRNLVQPGAQRSWTLLFERVNVTPSAQHRLLHGIFGLRE